MKITMSSLLTVLMLSILLSSGVCFAGMGELMDIARAQDDAQNTYVKETKAFERVKADIGKGLVKKGQSKKEIESLYGEPVVNTAEFGTGRKKWIYKPASSSFFSGIKACLYFDIDNKLDEIKVTE